MAEKRPAVLSRPGVFLFLSLCGDVVWWWFWGGGTKGAGRQGECVGGAV